MEQDKPTLILVRGLPGSGKTTLAEKIANEKDIALVAADDYFTDEEGNYKFNFSYISEAHEYCRSLAFLEIMNGRSVVVHNTFVERWTMDKYILKAIDLGIPWEIHEPKTKWRNDVEECFNKNTHNVPMATIQKMSDNWEPTKKVVEYYLGKQAKA